MRCREAGIWGTKCWGLMARIFFLSSERLPARGVIDCLSGVGC